MGSPTFVSDNVSAIDTTINDADDKKQRRVLLWKLDIFILSWACFGYFVRILDSSNISNAYVSGLKEDLNVQGNEYNLFSTLWTCGYIIGQIPSQLIITKIRPSIWIPCAEVLWAIFSFSFAAVKNVQQVYALRFLIGLAESPFYVGAMTMLGNWYTPKGQTIVHPYIKVTADIITYRIRKTSYNLLLSILRGQHVLRLSSGRCIQGPGWSSWACWLEMAIHHVWCDFRPWRLLRLFRRP